MKKVTQDGAIALVERVRRDDTVRRIARALQAGSRRVDVSGLRGSAPALLIETLRVSLDRRVVVCCPDRETARDVCEDLKTLSTARIELFPEKHVFPQRLEFRENPIVRGKRNACLDTILRDKVEITVTSLSGFLGKTIPVETLRAHTREMCLGARLDLEEVREHLVSVGYEGTSIVEEPGEFAVRGAILDMYDPSWDQPVRLELSDDEVVSIRTFDVESQRSSEALENVRLLPAMGVIVNEKTLDVLSTNLRAAGLETETVSRIRREIEDHRLSHLLRRYAPAMGIEGSLLDYFERPPLLFFWDGEGLARSFEALHEDIEHVKTWVSDDEPLLGFHDYLHPPEYYTRREAAAVHLWGLSPATARGEADTSDAGQGASSPQAPAPRFARLRSATRLRRGSGSRRTFGLPRSRERACGEDAPCPPEREGPMTMHGPASSDVIAFRTAEHPAVVGKFDTLIKILRRLRTKGIDVFIYSESPKQRERLADMLGDDESLVHLPVGWITSGFVWESTRLAILTDHQIFHRSLPRPPQRRPLRRRQDRRPDNLRTGDFVVHVDYGIGRYLGLEKVFVDGHDTECLNLRYQGTDRIYVPLDQMHLVEKYVGKEGVVPSIDRLGSSKWQRTKDRTRKALEDVARDLLEIYAEREIATGFAFGADSQWQRELEASFPYEETPHQLKASEEIREDMESPKPMDRLICGDVGFGKTEVAVRAAFKAANDGKQVAVLVPTTILALQHYETFRERMKPFPVTVEMLSRFRSPSEQKKIVEGLGEGSVDIIIGTHRLLSGDVRFNDIGLLIVDEEHRFGVRSKEKLKRVKQSVDVLSMTATPIPRTLYMSLSGLRRISVIDTPPRNRHPVKTEILPFDEETISQAIRAEIRRGGQVFFVHNRVASIHSMQAFLERLLPDVRFGVAHGQMAEKELEKTILSFMRQKFDVLITTTIIESGLDFPNVNTIVIHRADQFGLAELYQLRGRVGRRELQAQAYLLVPRNFSITEQAGKRLQAMEEFEELGSGYRLAMRDLEIRGAGNVLGVEQHGQIAAVGFELYCRMLKEAVEGLKGRPSSERPACRIETRLPAFLPDDYVDDQNERMAIYKRLARLEVPEDADELENEIVDRFGALPKEAMNLVELTKMKLRAMQLGMGLIRFRPGRVVAEFLPGKSLSPRLCAELVETFEGRVLFKSTDPFGLSLALGPAAHPFQEAKKLLQVACDYDKTYNPPDREQRA